MPRALITPPPVSAGSGRRPWSPRSPVERSSRCWAPCTSCNPLDPSWRFLSEYALGRAGWLMTAAFVALAVSLLAAVVALARAVRTWSGRVGLVLLVIAAVGVLLAAVFPTDPITVPVGAQTTAGRLHNLGASLDWSPLGMLLVAWSLGRTTTWRPWRTRLLVAAAVPCVLTVVFTAVVAGAGGQFGPGVYAGGWDG